MYHIIKHMLFHLKFITHTAHFRLSSSLYYIYLNALHSCIVHFYSFLEAGTSTYKLGELFVIVQRIWMCWSLWQPQYHTYTPLVSSLLQFLCSRILVHKHSLTHLPCCWCSYLLVAG